MVKPLADVVVCSTSETEIVSQEGTVSLVPDHHPRLHLLTDL